MFVDCRKHGIEHHVRTHCVITRTTLLMYLYMVAIDDVIMQVDKTEGNWLRQI